MFRYAIEELVNWKKSRNRKPLIIRGARQVGKTWIMKEFGRTNYKNTAYINFDSNSRMQRLFSGDMDIQRIIMGLEIEANCKIDKNNTLIIFDEVQECPKALSSLKYFYENFPEYNIVAAGSLLGVALHEGTSFPVGKVAFLDLYPLNFLEFLKAVKEDRLADLIERNEYDIISTFKDKYIDLLKQYYFVGGMPEAVLEFSISFDFNEVREIQKRILSAYEQDFSKHANPLIVTKLRMLWNSIPSQLAKENKKFVYGLIKHGARAKEYEVAMTWLYDCGLIYKVGRIKKPDIPIKAYEDMSAFKLFILDVGLLTALSELDKRTLLEGNKIFTEFKGALTEQYVLQQLKSMKDIPIYYWSAENGTSEIDFIIQSKGRVVPIEVKAEENIKAKSLKTYHNKFSPEISIRTSMSDYRKEEWLVNIPLYCISQICKEIK